MPVTMIDIVMPSNNEEEFAMTAKRLGFRGLCFLYSMEYLQKAQNIEFDGIRIYKGLLADPADSIKLKQQLKSKEIFVAVKSTGNDRETMNNLKSSLFFSFEDTFNKDFMHQRASGLNHILCRLAKENNITIGLSLNSILDASNSSMVVGRMIQNISLCQKFKVKNLIASFASSPYRMRSPHDMESLFRILGHQKPEFLKEPPTQS